MPEEHVTQAMKHAELFRGLTHQQLERLAGITQREIYNRGDKVFSQGETGDKMYIIGQGQVEVVVRTSGGESFPVVYLGEGQVFGEMTLIDDGKRSASIYGAVDGTVVYSIPKNDFTQLCQRDTAIGYVMMRNLAQDLSFKLRHRDSDQSEP
jgi:CRP/FNR family transcriptional regulator